MTPELSKEKNPYAEAHERFAEVNAERSPRWLAQTRAAALSTFERLGFPTVALEDWKYVNVAPIAKQPFTLGDVTGVDLALASRSVPFTPESKGARLTFLNGVFQPGMSDVSGLPAAVFVGDLAQAFSEREDIVKAHFATLAHCDAAAFTALNTAFAHDGALIFIPKGKAVETPISLFFVTGPQEDFRVAHPRTLVIVEEAAIVTFIEHYIELCDEKGRFGNRVYLTNAVTEAHVGQGAHVERYKVQHEGVKSYHVADTQVRLGRASVFADHSIALGGQLSRNQLGVTFTAEGGECRLNGLYSIGGTQVADAHIFIDHAAPHCTSDLVYKGVLDGKSRGVFDGRVFVRKDAQMTNASTTNKNLLLSSEARADTKPQLEIFADDVKCGHGATVGQLDSDEIFYLLSRGLTEKMARSLLTYGFAREVIEKIKIASIKSHLDDIIAARMTRGDEKK
jgi:Fe-S cluster assembly protein SufD